MKGKTQRARRVLSILVSSAAIFGAHAIAHADKYIVTFKSSESYHAASTQWSQSETLNRLGLDVQGMQQQVKLLNTDATVTRALNNLEMVIIDTNSPEDIAKLSAHPEVADVEAEIFYAEPTPQSKKIGNKPRVQCNMEMPWGISAVKADKAWTKTKGNGARVLILDTGIDKNHADLKSRFEQGRDFIGSNIRKGKTTGFEDTNGHGTHVAGTIAADGTCLVGVAPEAKLLAGKVCSSNGCGSTAIVSGIDWGIEQRVDVISMSLGGALSTPSQQRAVERAEQARVVVVAASGNDGVRRISYPAAYPTVIAVGALENVNNQFKRAEFSQYGPGLDITAPGVNVISSVPVGLGRVSVVMIDNGDGKSTQVKSASFAGAPENATPVSGALVDAGLGRTQDIQGVSLRGKMALIKRGEIPFKDKALNAMNAGAIGVIMFNNTTGLGRGTVGEDGLIKIPVAMIEQSVGEQIRTTLSSGKAVLASVATEASNYDAYDGTSMATPHVSGVVALIKSANKTLTPAQVRDLVSRTAVNIGSADEYGSGLIDAEKAVMQARPTRKLDAVVGL